jgi:hypothetical protein
MKSRKLFAGCIVALLMIAAAGKAAEANIPPDTPIRIAMVFNEYSGGKKITSLPYLMRCNASKHVGDFSSLQFGFKVPINVKQGEVQYQDVGTHVDCQTRQSVDQNAFLVTLGVRYNVIYSPGPNSNKAAEWHPGQPLADDPIFGGFTANVRNVLMHDGQTEEVAMATDPVTGHVWKVEVTLNVVK